MSLSRRLSDATGVYFGAGDGAVGTPVDADGAAGHRGARAVAQVGLRPVGGRVLPAAQGVGRAYRGREVIR
eukprot:gene31900-54291_t